MLLTSHRHSPGLLLHQDWIFMGALSDSGVPRLFARNLLFVGGRLREQLKGSERGERGYPMIDAELCNAIG